MKKSKLVVLFASLLLLCSFNFIACSDDNDADGSEVIVSYTDLPMNAQTFMETYFGGNGNVKKIEKETYSNMVFFDVETKDGFEIMFNSDGEWQEIDAPDGSTVPSEVIPEQIMQTLNQQYQGYGVVEINKTGQNYNVELSNNQGGSSIILTFNQSGEIISSNTD